MTTMKYIIVGLTLTVMHTAALAQPAPIHNPVVARMPCALGTATPGASRHDGKPIRARFEPANKYDYALQPVSHTSHGAWTGDVRREIGRGLRGVCD